MWLRFTLFSYLFPLLPVALHLMVTTPHTADKWHTSMALHPRLLTRLLGSCLLLTSLSHHPKYDMLSLPAGELLLHSQSSNNAPGGDTYQDIEESLFE